VSARQAAREAASRLARAGVDEAPLEAEVLARAAAGLTRAQYFAGHDLRAEELTVFHSLVARRLQREPAAHILGMRQFYGLDFEVTPHALVPRPETELLVDVALTELEGRGRVGAGCCQPWVIDVGTGTGCVAVSVALHAPEAWVIATDRSARALAVACGNRDRHQAPVRLVAGDLVAHIGRADIILANLPYIPTDEVRALEPEVRDYEPIVALDGGPDGLSLIRRLIDDCATRVRPRLLALEVGYGQAGAVQAYAYRQGATTDVLKDLAGIDRVVCARWA
jgi:release factor glutamine methyltransferase